jgi:hypothetical protein
VKGALCNNGNVVVLPSWYDFLSQQSTFCDSLLPWLWDLSSFTKSVVDFVNKRKHGISHVPSIKFSRQMTEYDKVIGRAPKRP